MSEKALKVVPAPELKTAPDAATEAPAKSGLRARLGGKRLRTFCWSDYPLLAVIAGGIIYLMGGRYISTDNAYVGAQKVLITPDISGKVINVAVHEGQHVKPGDVLLTLDPRPYQLALDQAKAKLATARSDYDKAKIQSRFAQHAGRSSARRTPISSSATSTARSSWRPRRPARRPMSIPPWPDW